MRTNTADRGAQAAWPPRLALAVAGCGGGGSDKAGGAAGAASRPS